MISLIAGIKSRLPEADWPVVVAALRSEPQTWAELQDPVFAAQVLEAAGADRDRWSPAFIGLLRLDQQQLFEPLRAAPMQPVTEKLRYQAAAVYEKLAGKGAVGEQPTPDLSQATLLALAFRERRRLLGGWDQLADDLSIASAEFWRLPISCLFGLMPNPQELLAQLISIDQSTELQQLGLHALLSNPLPLDVQSAHLLELVRDFPLPHFLTLLRSLTNVNAPLAQQAAVQALENLQDRDHGNNPGLSEIQRLLLEAEVRQISGQSAQADSLLRSAWEASRQLEVDLAAKVAEANGADVDAVAALQESADPKKIRNRSKRPTSLLAAANVAFKSGDATEAKELAVAALRSATKETEPADSRKALLLRQLSDLFVELELTEEALSAAEAALQAQPNDAECALQFSKLLLKNEKTVEALQQAHLAVALAPDRGEVRRNLAKALQNNHQPVGAFREWKAMLDHEDQPTIEDWLSFAESGLQSNHIDEAIKACQYALALQPTNGAAYALLGSALLAQGDEGSALAYLRRATELAPAQIEAWLALAQLQIAGKAPQEALTALISAQQFTQPSARLQGLLATILQTLGRDEEALATYEKAAQLADEQVDTETAQSVALKYSRQRR
ncbi:MAG: tetratricopeptide repeat protein, partial [Chloroflexi bacterium]|nr:tetratricopeptide repeat protein [Chloroflexota bacterium]